jgi:hypothetical protein
MQDVDIRSGGNSARTTLQGSHAVFGTSAKSAHRRRAVRLGVGETASGRSPHVDGRLDREGRLAVSGVRRPARAVAEAWKRPRSSPASGSGEARARIIGATELLRAAFVFGLGAKSQADGYLNS